jgi:DNA-directed RNA polymerase subunit RPC12/RpoP
MPGNRPMYFCPRCKTGIPFGTTTEPPRIRCPGCQKPLGIPNVLDPIPLIHATCPACSADFSLNGYYAGGPCFCPECGVKFTAPGNSPFST